MATFSGLSNEEAARLKAEGKANVVPSKSSKSVAAIIASNVFTYFNGIFAVLAVLVVAAGTPKNLTFLPVVVTNTIIGIVQQLRSKKVLDELALLDVSHYTVIRNGEDRAVASEELVQGDLIRLEGGQQIPADAVVIDGEAGINESLLTGEEDEVHKAAGSDLMSGSFVVAGQLVARLTHVGSDSYAAQLTSRAKQIHDKTSEMVADIDRIIIVAGILIVPVGGLMVWQALANGATFTEAINSMVSAVTGMIPEGLYLLVTIALALSAMRLARQTVMLHDMRSIETLARVDVLCVDKTGTITTGDMIVEDVFGPHGQPREELGDALGALSSYVATASDNNATMAALREGFPGGEPFEDAEVEPFTSRLKYSQVSAGGKTMRLGAPDVLLGREALESCGQFVDAHAEVGRRVLALIELDGDDAYPLLFVSISNEVRPDAPSTFAEFERQGVQIKVISGDNPLTVSTVAERAGIARAERYVDASTLDDEQKIRAAVKEYTVFGRVKPEQKKELVLALKEEGLRVAMTGDGVNDILAMKEADCSIAMGSGSDAARQSAQVVLLDSNFSHMLKIVSEGRRNINNITRSATLFLYKNVFSFSLALFTIFGSFAYPLTINQVSLISFFNIGLPAFLLAFEPNEKKQEGRFIVEVLFKSLPAALTSFFAIALMMLFADLFQIMQNDVATASTYLLSVVGFLILISLIRPPNPYRIMVLAVCAIGFITVCGFFWKLFDIYDMSTRAWVLCGLFAFAEVGVLQILSALLEYIRKRFVR